MLIHEQKYAFPNYFASARRDYFDMGCFNCHSHYRQMINCFRCGAIISEYLLTLKSIKLEQINDLICLLMTLHAVYIRDHFCKVLEFTWIKQVEKKNIHIGVLLILTLIRRYFRFWLY